MSSFFSTAYTIHFDDTMAYGSHHFLTAFKFQCAGREDLLYGDLIFDLPGVPESLEGIHLFTADAYSRNLSPVYLGDRVAILISLEEWGRVSARFCYRVLGEKGQTICAGFQNMICADAETGMPIPLPDALRDAYDNLREITEVETNVSFRDRVLKGTSETEQLFTDEIRTAALAYLSDRYPYPRVIRTAEGAGSDASGSVGVSVQPSTIPNSAVHAPETPSVGVVPSISPLTTANSIPPNYHAPDEVEGGGSMASVNEVWVFSGQGTFDAVLLSERVVASSEADPAFRAELDQCAAIAEQEIGGDAYGVVSGDVSRCLKAVQATPDLSQVAIHLQSVLGARLRSPITSGVILMGHSFGELAALNVGGCFDLPTGIRVVCKRVRAVADYGPQDGGLLVAKTSRRVVAEELAVGGFHQVKIAGRNHDGQTVVSGPRTDLSRVTEALRRCGVEAVSISSPTSFHHPALRDAAQAWMRELQALPIHPPKQPIYSTIGRNVISPGDDIPSILSSHFLRPFDLQGAVEDLIAGGTPTFVDCGSGGSLARLLRKAGPDSINVVAVQDGPKPTAAPSQSRIPSPPVMVQDGTASASPAPGTVPTASQSISSASQLQAASSSNPVKRTPIAIVGQGCLLPGRATSPKQLYSAITEGRLGIVDQRQLDPDWERDFHSETLVPDRSTSALAGRVDNRDIIAPLNVDESIFASFSRGQQILCVALAPCIDALQRAKRVVCLVGATADGFCDQDGFSVLRYGGVEPNDSQILQRLGDERSVFQDPYTAIQEVFDRVVRRDMDVKLVDAACASSLYSVALGMQALEDGEVDLVLAGGMFCPGPGNNCLFSQFGGLTSTGCRPFDANADGVVFSEGAAVVLLQRLADAEQQNGPIHGVIRGAGLSSDGKSSSANVPQSAGQILALERCYSNYDVSPQSIVAIEGHGTSTPVGDATELRTLRNFFSSRTQSTLPVHSLKGLIGHSGWAAGTASLIAVCEVLRKKVFPAQAFHRSPSAALSDADGVLSVPTQPISLSSERNAIAIDGFGFGGANAHLVVESHADHRTYEPSTNGTFVPINREAHNEKELVVVGWHQLVPKVVDATADGTHCARFDREAAWIPENMLVLPDLADDMDISQKLALAAVDGTLNKIAGMDEALRKDTAIVLAQAGKTERAVEATTRILEPRLMRELDGLEAAQSVANAANVARPSGPYTLQCMMPNVSAGRAALQFDLNGPNFVVDSGANSLEAAISSARLLLHNGHDSGTKLAIVLAISANRWAVPTTDSAVLKSEYALSLAVTTRAEASRLGLEVVETVDSVLDQAGVKRLPSTEEKVAAVAAAFEKPKPVPPAPHPKSEPQSQPERESQPERQPAKDEFPIHAPIWVETIGLAEQPTRTLNRHERWLVIAAAKEESTDELLGTLPSFCEHARVALVGPAASAVADRINNPNVFAMGVSDEAAAQSALAAIVDYGPDVVVALDRPSSWGLSESLDATAQNDLCESLFLTIKSLVARVRESRTEVWGVFPGAWNEVVHPVTGSLTGLIKSVKRELPEGRLGVLSCRSESLQDALNGLQYERSLLANVEQEIVHSDGKRWVRRLRQVEGPTPLEAKPVTAPFGLSADSVVIASGGARGVTAVSVEALLQDYGCTVIAFGRSPLEKGPPNTGSAEVEQEYYAQFVAENPHASPVEMRKSFETAQARWEAHETIDRMSRMGGCIRYMAVDVTNRDQVDQTVGQIVDEFGRVDLLLHGAGVQWSKKIETRSLAEFRKTFDVKVTGLYHLLDRCRSRVGRLVPTHIFTSAYSIFGNDGQHDYGAANEAMDRLCGLTKILPEHHWSSIAWSAWDGIGMTRGSEYRALAARRNLTLLGAAGGQKIFRAVIEGRTGAEINVALSEAERTRYTMRTLPPMRTDAIRKSSESPVRLASLDCLDYHHARGVRTVPGAWISNFMARAVLDMHEAAAEYVTIEDVRFSRFIRVANEHDTNIRIILDKNVDGDSHGYTAWMIGDILNPDGIPLATDVVFSEAKLSIGNASVMDPASLNGISRNGSPVRMVEDPYCVSGQTVQLTGPFDCLQKIEIGDLGRHAIFRPDTTTRWEGVVPSLLLDASLRVAGMHVAPGLHVPTTIDRVVMPFGIAADASAAAGWKIRSSDPIVDGDEIHCERIEVSDADGHLRLCIEGAQLTRLR